MDIEESEDVKQPGQGIERLATEIARNRTNVSMWDMNIVVVLFGLLVIVVIMISMDVNTLIVAPVAIPSSTRIIASRIAIT